MLTLVKKKKFDEQHGPVLDFIFRVYDKIASMWMEELELNPGPEPVLQLYDSTGRALSEIYGRGNGSEGRDVLNMTTQIIDSALKQRASDILIDPQDRATYAVRFRIDGALRTTQEIPLVTCKAVINIVKAVSNMDIAERRRPQDGAFTAGTNGSTVSFRVASAGALNGEKLSIRVLNRNVGAITMADTGIPQNKCAAICEAVNLRPA
jgi:type II secretory ATPase GspE/PulE/Tfp pilus assembly ATPase PilB-like protein